MYLKQWEKIRLRCLLKIKTQNVSLLKTIFSSVGECQEHRRRTVRAQVKTEDEVGGELSLLHQRFKQQYRRRDVQRFVLGRGDARTCSKNGRMNTDGARRWRGVVGEQVALPPLLSGGPSSPPAWSSSAPGPLQLRPGGSTLRGSLIVVFLFVVCSVFLALWVGRFVWSWRLLLF